MTAKIIEKTVPEQITTPIGIQRELPLMIMGTTPTAVVAEVRKIGEHGVAGRRRRRHPSGYNAYGAAGLAHARISR